MGFTAESGPAYPPYSSQFLVMLYRPIPSDIIIQWNGIKLEKVLLCGVYLGVMHLLILRRKGSGRGRGLQKRILGFNSDANELYEVWLD